MGQQTDNVFKFEHEVEQHGTDTRKMAWTDTLISLSTTRAIDLIKNQAKQHPELTDSVKKVLTNGEATDLFDLLNKYYAEQITTDSECLVGANADELSRLLESRRSERSVAKRAGIQKTVINCSKFFAAGYAELMIRNKMNKPYSSTSSVDVDESDLDAVGRKIKSLQSKKSRLSKLAAYDPAAKAELSEVIKEIDRLNSFRPTSSGVSSSSVLKNINVDELRAVLAGINLDDLPEDERSKYASLIEKLG